MFIELIKNDIISSSNLDKIQSWRDYILSIIVNRLEKTIGIEACFIYGSSQFNDLSTCKDIDVLLVSKSHMGLFWVSLESKLIPPLSITITDMPTLINDLKHGGSAGFILNKFINPITICVNPDLILNVKHQIISTLAKTLNINNYYDLLLWKDVQFPGWRKNHFQNNMNFKITSGLSTQNIFLDLPCERGHWEVYKSIKTNWGQEL